MIYHVYTFTSNRPWERIIVIGCQCSGCFLFLLLLDYRYICIALYVFLDQRNRCGRISSLLCSNLYSFSHLCQTSQKRRYNTCTSCLLNE